MKIERNFERHLPKKKGKAKRALLEKQKMLEVVSSLTPDVIYLYSARDRHHIYINKEMATMLGYTSAEIQAAGADLLLKAIHPDDLPRVIQHIQTLAETLSNEIFVLEYRIQDKNGRYLWFHVREQVYQRDEDQRPQILFGICQDITPRKLAEQSAQSLARLYATLSQVNQAIVRAKDQQALFQEICTIAVEYGKFRLAWIGVFDAGTGQVHPAAVAGAEGVQLPFSDINVYQAPFVNGLMGVALNTGQIQYSNDIQLDSNMAHWHVYAAGDLFHSAAAIPIRQNGQMIGLLNLYARDIDFFLTLDEQKLLAEIGEDISFALDTMENLKSMRQWGDAFVNCAHGIAIEIPATNRILTCNPTFAKLQGRTVEELRGMPVLNLYAPHDHAYVHQAILSADNSGSAQFEAHMKRQDGSVYPVQMDVVSVRSAAGKLLYRVTNQQDISGRKQAEEKQQASEHTLKLFVEYAPAAIAMFDRNMIYIAASRRYLIDYRLTETNVVGRSHYDIFPEIPERWKVIHRRCQAGAIEQAEEDPFPRADGSLDWLRWEIHPWYEASGQIGGILLFSEVITARKQAEEALRESRERLARAQQIAHLGSWELDLVSNHLTWSDEVYRIFGSPPQAFQATYEAFLEHVYPEDREVVDAAYGNSIRDNQDGYEIEHRLIQPHTGEIRYVQEKCEHFRDASGQVVRSVGMIHDITERKQAEEQITRLAERLDLAARSAHLGIWDWDIVQDKLIWDVRMYELYGIREDSFEGVYAIWLNGLHPEDRARSDEALRQALSGEKEFDIEFRVVWPDKTVRWIKAYGQVIRDANNQPLRMVGINYDVTERKQAEFLLRASEALLRQRNTFIESILENAPIGFAVNEISTGRATFVSKNFDTLYGLPPGTLTSIDDYFEKVFTDPVFRAEFRARVLDDLASGDPARMRWENLPITTAAGEHRVVTAINIPLLEQDLMISTVQDVTERWLAEDKIRMLNAELEQRVIERTSQLEAANRELEAFSYSVSHDLRAPLRGIDGWSLALFEDCYEQLDEKGREYIARVRAETQRMGHLIDDLLRLSRLSRAEMQRGEIDLSELAHSIVLRIMETQPDRSVQWIIQPGLKAFGDMRLMEIVLTNLLSNAFKFTSKLPQAQIAFGETLVDGKPAYFVRDNGAGFNMAHAKNLFGAFQRMHKQTDFPGTGIGLATAQRIIRRHGGAIWAEAERNAGATFYFTLEEAA